MISDYLSETEEQLLIRQQRGQASNVSLASPNVRRVYNDFRTTRQPVGRSMASHSGHEEDPARILTAIFPTASTATMTGAVGVGSNLPTTVPAGTAAVGVRTPVVASTSAVPSTSRGKEPRQARRSRSRSRSGSRSGPVSSGEERRRELRAAAERRFSRLL